MMAIVKSRVLEIEKDLIEALKKNDLGFFARALHDEMVFLAPNGQVLTKQMDLDSHIRGDMVVHHLIPSVEEVRISGDIATVVVVYETKGTMMGHPIEGKFRYLRVWKEFADGLKVIAGGCCMLSEA
jgi:ketosteroid isomerase-like protein